MVRRLGLSAVLNVVLACAVSGALALSAGGCDGDEAGAAATNGADEVDGLDLRGEPIEPPFAVHDELEGLLIVWFDAEGPHTASTRSEIPEANRERVRVDSLRLSPEERDPDHVYVADVRVEREGRYEVRRLPRETFDALVDRAAGTTVADRRAAAAGDGQGGAQEGANPGANADADIIIYGASWCSACHAAARYLTQRGVAFVEKDIERDPTALAEMQAKARRAGINPSGIPVIDLRGTIITGFDQRRIDAILSQ